MSKSYEIVKYYFFADFKNNQKKLEIWLFLFIVIIFSFSYD